MSAGFEKIPNIDLTVKAESLEDDLFAVYKRLFPEAIQSDLTFEELVGGYVNCIMRVTPKKGAKGNDKSLVFRSFGMKFNQEEFNKQFAELRASEKSKQNADQKLVNGDANNNVLPAEPDEPLVFFDRFSEFKVMHVVSKYGLCQPVFATYTNGICYGFTEGATVSGPLMLTSDFLNEASSQLAKFHSIDYEVPDAKHESHYDRLENSLLPQLQGSYEEMDKQIEAIDDPIYKEIPRIQAVFDCEKKLKDTLNDLGLGELVLSHNDVNSKNVIWNAQTRKLSFIDFEMCLKNYPAFDIGYLISCYTGHFLCDFDEKLYPNEAYLREFCRNYLSTYYEIKADKKPTKERFERELEELYHKVNLAAMLNLLRWAMYSVFFDIHPEMFHSKEVKEKRLKDKYFNVNYSVAIYKFVLPASERFVKEAEDYLEKRKQTRL